MAFDEKDRKIAEYFAENPRSSFTQASKSLEWTKTTIKNRHEKLANNEKVKTFLCLNASNAGFCHALSFVEIVDSETEKAILEEFDRCPLITTVFSLSGFEYSLVICLAGEKREDINKFIDVFPLSQLSGVKRRNSYLAKKTEGFAEKPFWIPLSPDPDKGLFKEHWCGLNCESCLLIKNISEKLDTSERTK
ncbi:MAG: Lrp/AsnC family transcriptional regulator [Candidatus Hodarchaeales archaeon]